MAAFKVLICMASILYEVSATCKFNCGKDMTCNVMGCFCNVTNKMQRCNEGQDCHYQRGCTCLQPECACGVGDNEYCDGPDLCENKKCKCGGTAGKICNDGEQCVLGKCFCNTETHITCTDQEVCIDGNCLCGDKKCGTDETCVVNQNDLTKSVCLCGNMWRRCTMHETCEHKDGTYACKCGNDICRYDESCETVDGKETCVCGAKICADKEICIRKTEKGEPFCLCGNKQCGEGANCESEQGEDGNFFCNCSTTDCVYPSSCVDGQCLPSDCIDQDEDCDDSEITNLCFVPKNVDLVAEFARELCPGTCRACAALQEKDEQDSTFCGNTDCKIYTNGIQCPKTCKVSD